MLNGLASFCTGSEVLNVHALELSTVIWNSEELDYGLIDLIENGGKELGEDQFSKLNPVNAASGVLDI